MKNIKSLSDNQLIALFKSDNIDKYLKNAIIEEIDRRDLKEVQSKNYSIDLKQKAFIFFTNYFLYKYHLNKANEILIDGNKKTYKQYWRIFSLGVGFSFVILLLLSKFYFRKLI